MKNYTFSNFMLDVSDGIHDVGSIRWELAGCLLLAWSIVYMALWKGIKSIGKVCTFSQTLPNFDDTLHQTN